LAESHSIATLAEVVGFTSDAEHVIAIDAHKGATPADDDSHLFLFRVPSLELVDRIPISHVRSVAISPDGKRLVIAVTDALILWDISEKKIVWSVPLASVMKIVFSADGEFVATELADRTIVVHNSSNGQTRIQLTHLRTRTTGMIFTPDNRTLVSGTTDDALIFSHIATGQGLLRVEQIGKVIRFEFSDRGRFLVCLVDCQHLNAPPEIVVLNASDPADNDDTTQELE
jgi:WD40 repeat protein